MRARKHRYAVLTVKEPFPVFFSHVEHQSELRPETAKGPFYRAGSQRHHLDIDGKGKAFAEWQAAGLREKGWTVEVHEEWR